MTSSLRCTAAAPSIAARRRSPDRRPLPHRHAQSRGEKRVSHHLTRTLSWKERGVVRARQSLAGSAFPGRAWERGLIALVLCVAAQVLAAPVAAGESTTAEPSGFERAPIRLDAAQRQTIGVTYG